MAKLTVTPPPKPIERTFTLVLTEAEAMHIWAALGPSSVRERWDYAEKRLKRKLSHNLDAGHDVYVQLDNVFGKKSKQAVW